eukprot:864251-Lingulodinium_polyedra.AAC.1
MRRRRSPSRSTWTPACRATWTDRASTPRKGSLRERGGLWPSWMSTAPSCAASGATCPPATS